MKYCTDLILGKAFCIVIFFHFSDSRLKRFPFIFLMAWQWKPPIQEWGRKLSDVHQTFSANRAGTMFDVCERFVLLRAVAVHALPDVFMACEYSLRREIGSSSLYVLFSQCRSCDNALTSCFVQTSSYSSAHARIIYEKKIPVRPSLGKSINKLRQISRSLFELFFFLRIRFQECSSTFDKEAAAAVVTSLTPWYLNHDGDNSELRLKAKEDWGELKLRSSWNRRVVDPSTRYPHPVRAPRKRPKLHRNDFLTGKYLRPTS